MKVLLATGGTGGHIYPAIALAEKIVLDSKEHQLLFVGHSTHMEAREIPSRGYRFMGIEVTGFNNLGVSFKSLMQLYRAYKKSLSIVKEFKPDIVVGFGSFITVPVVMAAKKLGIPVLLHEQNCIAGLANKVLGHFADKVVTVYSDVNKQFPSRKVVTLGNPRESATIGFIKDRKIFEQYGLDCDRKTLLIVMGSLGSASVNEKMVSILEKMKQKDYNVIYVTGRRNYDEIRILIKDSDNVKVVDYIDQLNIAGNCDLVVSRGGATSACEYMALGIPTIIVPSPFVPNNHQFINAKSMADAGASVILEEKDLTESSLLNLVDELINDDARLQKMSQNARLMSHPQAAYKIIDLMKEMTGTENGK
ncbi:MAG: undecaprenyldiphospho-muramoylpentapeptide beta-N-acetylglucosaminyltransferase [Erysipelotrichaceae bacterium]|nr:undecaprenyldiphospho-muramoylpentapeptide beta-N-acetylglucosaminyltransferase [Erysipelotrichaceae bacterium]